MLTIYVSVTAVDAKGMGGGTWQTLKLADDPQVSFAVSKKKKRKWRERLTECATTKGKHRKPHHCRRVSSELPVYYSFQLHSDRVDLIHPVNCQRCRCKETVHWPW